MQPWLLILQHVNANAFRFACTVCESYQSPTRQRDTALLPREILFRGFWGEVRDKRLLRRCCQPSASWKCLIPLRRWYLKRTLLLPPRRRLPAPAAAARRPETGPGAGAPAAATPRGRDALAESHLHRRRSYPGTVPALRRRHRPASRVTGDGPLPRPAPDPTAPPRRRRHFALLAAERAPAAPAGKCSPSRGMAARSGGFRGADYNSRQAPPPGSALTAQRGNSRGDLRRAAAAGGV